MNFITELGLVSRARFQTAGSYIYLAMLVLKSVSKSVCEINLSRLRYVLLTQPQLIPCLLCLAPWALVQYLLNVACRSMRTSLQLFDRCCKWSFCLASGISPFSVTKPLTSRSTICKPATSLEMFLNSLEESLQDL